MTSTSLVSRALNVMEAAIEWLIAISVAVMVANITMGIFCRYVLNSALSWTEEMSRYLMIWVGMMGASLAMKDDSHVGISFVVNLFPPAAGRILKVLSRLVVSLFLAVVLVKSFSYLNTLSIQRSPAMELPMMIPYLSVTVGVILMSIENIVKITQLFSTTATTKNGE